MNLDMAVIGLIMTGTDFFMLETSTTLKMIRKTEQQSLKLDYGIKILEYHEPIRQ